MATQLNDPLSEPSAESQPADNAAPSATVDRTNGGEEEDKKRVKFSSDEVTVVFFVLGRRGTNGWPLMTCVFNPKDREDFEQSVRTALGDNENDVLKRELAYFVIGRMAPSSLYTLNFLNDANVVVPDGWMECADYAELVDAMNWSQ